MLLLYLLGEDMFVRVYDKPENRYYKSIVYGLFNVGYYEQAIVFNPFTQCFEMIDYFDKTSKKPEPLYEYINSNSDEWISYEKTFLLKFKYYCKEHGFLNNISLFQGYKEVFENFVFLLKILQDKKVSLQDANILVRSNEDNNDWNYIRTQEDANAFMHSFVGFHDATLDKIIYEEEYRKTQLKAIFNNSGWYGVVELCFEGAVAMNLRAPSENHSCEIYDATLIVKDESIFWADAELKEEDYNYGGTYIKALNLKWRKI